MITTIYFSHPRCTQEINIKVSIVVRGKNKLRQFEYNRLLLVTAAAPASTGSLEFPSL